MTTDNSDGPTQWIALLEEHEEHEREGQRVSARTRAVGAANGIGAAYVGVVRNRRGDEEPTWQADFVVVDGDQEVEVVVTSRTHSRDERPEPSLLARIVELAAAERSDRDLNMLGSATVGVTLEDHDTVITDLAFRTGPRPRRAVETQDAVAPLGTGRGAG
jgi:hypothetical protein